MTLGWVKTTTGMTSCTFAGATLLLSASSIPAGWIDISDFWPIMRQALVPTVPLLALLLARRIPRRWIRIPASIASSLTVCFAGALFLFLCLSEAGCEKRVAPMYSPDGKHVALVRISLGGALSEDFAEITVRHAWWPFPETAYIGVGGWHQPTQAAYPEVRWLDSSRLLIRYNPEGQKPCPETVAGIRLICEKMIK